MLAVFLSLHSNILNLVNVISAHRKQKKHSSKRNGGKPQLGGVEEEADDVHGTSADSSSPTKKKAPVKFYIDEREDHEEKENLITAPEIVVDPPSDVHARTPDREFFDRSKF